jgi:BirA family biotin operon repressor/biotin-[acetyl-CoA-carboxylase] ligase
LKDVIIGTGINVNQEVFLSDAPNPVSLKNITGQEHDRNTLLRDILERFSIYYKKVQDNPQTIVRLYHEHLYRRTGLHAYADKDGTFQAEIVSVADNGIITLRRNNGTISHYEFKELRFC